MTSTFLITALFTAAVLPFAASASDSGCVSGYHLKSIDAQGKTITLEDGEVITTQGGGVMAAQSWNTGDSLMLCKKKILNLSDNYSQVIADREAAHKPS